MKSLKYIPFLSPKFCIKGSMTCATTEMDIKSIYDSKEIANHFIRRFIGIMSTGLSCKTHIMLRHTKDIIQKRKFWFNNVSSRLTVQKESTNEIYKKCITELFHASFKWGQVVSLFAFSGLIAKFLESNDVISWLQDELISRNNSIIENGEWSAFTLKFRVRPWWFKWLNYLL